VVRSDGGSLVWRLPDGQARTPGAATVELHRGDVWPCAVVGTVLFQMSFQALPLYLRFSDQLLALRAFGGLVILLVWLYLMANIIVLGAEINWFHWSRRQPPTEEELAGGLA
jgi:uncharacterized BrkB/YihY/UPF0761 family membrane protein